MKHLEDKVDNLSELDLKELVVSICYEAQDIYTKCGFAKDCTLEHCAGGRLIFGTANRLSWSASSGWEVSGMFCQTDFLRRFQILMTGE